LEERKIFAAVVRPRDKFITGDTPNFKLMGRDGKIN